MESETLGISPIVFLKLEYLRDTKHIPIPAKALQNDLEKDIGLQLLEDPFPGVIQEFLGIKLNP